MNPISITSANAKVTLTVRSALGIVVGPFTVEGYHTDTAFQTEAIAVGEAAMGVDGKLAGGRTPQPVPMAFSLMANSPSIVLFDTWKQAQDAIGDILICEAAVAAPSLGRGWTYLRGILTQYTPMPAARKTFSDPLNYAVMFESVTTAPLQV